MESLRLSRILGQVFEERFTVDMFECRLSFLHAVFQILPNSPVPIRAHEDNKSAQAIGCVAAQQFGQWGQAEPPFIFFGKHTHTRESTQQAVQWPRLNSRGLGKLVRLYWSILQQISDTQFGCH